MTYSMNTVSVYVSVFIPLLLAPLDNIFFLTRCTKLHCLLKTMHKNSLIPDFARSLTRINVFVPNRTHEKESAENANAKNIIAK